ncbi:YeiH family protein [Brevibacillus migulae]|uniref:YeiH family protein n=1 Tax=Brevibacillus migulae TaxID=1644114 RepID=UPI00106EE63B|nr:putative sulfate exporter family transporter [Brevibacillus migulae]
MLAKRSLKITRCYLKMNGWLKGVSLTFLLALIAMVLAQLPGLDTIGPLIIAIVLGMAANHLLSIPPSASPGVSFSAKQLLRAGIILLGLRLDFHLIMLSGLSLLVISAINILLTLWVVYTLGRRMQLDHSLSLLLASGTSICGASAIAAIGSQTSAKQDAISLSVVTIALAGTLCTIALSLLFPFLDVSASTIGLFAGLTLHEIAHVMAASSPGGEAAIDAALLAKLCRVALLVFVALGIQLWLRRSKHSTQSPSSQKDGGIFPWFIIGFLLMGGVRSLAMLPTSVIHVLLFIATFLLTMAMAGMGLVVKLSQLRDYGSKPILVVSLGTTVLMILGFLETILLA